MSDHQRREKFVPGAGQGPGVKGILRVDLVLGELVEDDPCHEQQRVLVEVAKDAPPEIFHESKLVLLFLGMEFGKDRRKGVHVHRRKLVDLGKVAAPLEPGRLVPAQREGKGETEIDQHEHVVFPRKNGVVVLEIVVDVPAEPHDVQPHDDVDHVPRDPFTTLAAMASLVDPEDVPRSDLRTSGVARCVLGWFHVRHAAMKTHAEVLVVEEVRNQIRPPDGLELGDGPDHRGVAAKLGPCGVHGPFLGWKDQTLPVQIMFRVQHPVLVGNLGLERRIEVSGKFRVHQRARVQDGTQRRAKHVEFPGVGQAKPLKPKFLKHRLDDIFLLLRLSLVRHDDHPTFGHFEGPDTFLVIDERKFRQPVRHHFERPSVDGHTIKEILHDSRLQPNLTKTQKKN